MKKIVLMCKEGDSSFIVYNKLIQHYKIERVIIENPVSKKALVKRRIKKIGFFKTVGQILFSLLMVPVLTKKGKRRKQEILDTYGASIESEKMLTDKVVRVESVNSKECKEILQAISPNVIVVNGTRIISKEILSCVDAIFINMHAGITPKYRGSHGAYWARYNDDIENAGVTVHLVDEGIDTGNILYQAKIEITDKDNFTTYPTLQTCVGVEYEIKAISDIINGEVKTISNDLPSSLYSHPTFFQYLYKRIKHGVK